MKKKKEKKKNRKKKTKKKDSTKETKFEASRVFFLVPDSVKSISAPMVDPSMFCPS